MSTTLPKQGSQQQARQGSCRRGTTIEAIEHKLRFEIPIAWVRWYEENEACPNLHLTPDELDAVKETEGEWDREFALVVNAILPFDQCIAHVGNDGWGPRGISYADLQVRVYVFAATPKEIEERARSRGVEVIASLTGSPTVLQQEQVGVWKRTLLQYSRWYVDYGATASIDLRMRLFRKQMIVFAFMYTDHAEHDAEIETLLGSVVFAD